MKNAASWIIATMLCAGVLAGLAWTSVAPDADRPPAYVFEARPAGAEGPLARCVVCHAVMRDGSARAAPPLYGIVGAPKARTTWYGYSAALKAAGGVWTERDLDQFLAGPARFVSGTLMNIAGISDANERAAIILALKQTR